MELYWVVAVFAVMAPFFQMLPPSTMADCPLNLSRSNLTLVASMCSDQGERGKCCRYINALVAISIAEYAHSTGELGVDLVSQSVCLQSISQILELYGIPSNAAISCGFGTKIPLNYACRGRTTVTQVLQSPGFGNVADNCPVSHLNENDCRKCINASLVYLRRTVGVGGNLTLNICRDATFVSLASQANNNSAVQFARCFFRVPRIYAPVQRESSVSPTASPSPSEAQSPRDLSSAVPHNKHNHPYHLALIPGVAIGVSVISVVLLAIFVFLIRRKSKELDNSEGNVMKPSAGTTYPRPHQVLNLHEGPSTLRKFTYNETKKATDNFTTLIGQGGFGTVYRAQFGDGSIAAIKRIDKVSEQADDEICKEIELLARLHHRHLVALKGFCIEKQERFLMYEYMENGSLKDNLHSPERTPLSWLRRIQIAIDVANALEYLHLYCDPPLCHRDIKSSNILLDGNFVAKVADFGLAHASKGGSICFEPINTDVRGTPGYMDPEYVVTRELTEKSDVYSYGVVLLELVTGRRAIQDKTNLVEWAGPHLSSESKVSHLVDPALGDSFDHEQLQTMVEIIKWCTHHEGRSRPSIKQVLRLLYECSDPMHGEFSQAVEDEENYGGLHGQMRRATSKGKGQKMFHSGEGKYFPSSSSTTRSYCSRTFLLENGSPPSPPDLQSL